MNNNGSPPCQGGPTYIVADGVANVDLIGPDLHINLFRWREVNGVLRRAVVGVVSRPLCTFTPEQLLFFGDGWLNTPTLLH